jgi:hypothetical protein
MINQEELAICRRRGHTTSSLFGYWVQCAACGMWIREVRTIEESEETPPEGTTLGGKKAKDSE